MARDEPREIQRRLDADREEGQRSLVRHVPGGARRRVIYGWIDGQTRPFDERTWLQRFTPRGPRSIWSKINTGKADALIKAGRMRAAGLAAIEAAKSSGRWESAYQAWSTLDVPPELQAALDASPNAKAFFATLRGANRYGVIFRVQTAKKPETRAKRIADFIARFEKGETLFGPERQAAAKKKPKKLQGRGMRDEG